MKPSFRTTLHETWPEALIEAISLGLFMISALGFTILFEHSASPVRASLPNADLRRFLIGGAMGATLLALVYNRFGARSGAHLNPAFTFTFWRLGKLDGAKAGLYAVAQFLGAAAGVALVAGASPGLAADAHVRHAATEPGIYGIPGAFVGEVVIAFVQMSIVLHVSNSRRLHAWTGVFAAIGVALYIGFEAPLSGMSMNPARTLASALFENRHSSLWIYFSAPLAGMLLAAELYVRRVGIERVYCAKVHHANDAPCPFRCRYPALVGDAVGRPV